MSLLAAAKPSPRNTGFVSFMAAALAVHGLLLMLPAQRGLEPGRVLRQLSVTLQGVAQPAPVREAEAEPAPPDTATPPAHPAAAPPEAEADRPPSTELPADGGHSRQTPDAGLTAARLLDDAFRMRWELPRDGESRRLGEPEIPGSGPDLSAGIAPVRDGGIEIVDRWQSADGSRNVLVRTPSGGMLCGRAAAWDPLQPLTEPIMMWRDCGSGLPTFEWPERFRNGTPRPR